MLTRQPPHHAPLLLCIDLQREHITPGRPLYTADAQGAIRGCVRTLKHARRCGWTVIHAHRRRPGGGLFSGSGEATGAIEGLWPLASERLFRREGLSAFSSPPLAHAVARGAPSEVYMIGLSLHQACLATALSGADLGLNLVMVADATAAAPLNGRSAEEVAAIAGAILEPHVFFTTSDMLPVASDTDARGV